MDVFPGLKPQAESCSPFGTKTSLTAVHGFDYGSLRAAGFEDEDEALPARRSPLQRYRIPGLGSGWLKSEVFNGCLGLAI